jgi:hypothetical protein
MLYKIIFLEIYPDVRFSPKYTILQSAQIISHLASLQALLREMYVTKFEI